MSGPTPSAVFGLLSSQATYRAPVPTTSFEGQTVIITGANTGLGRDAARHIVRLNASRVILAVRSVTKGEQARESIENEFGRKGVLEVWQVDMASFASVKAFAQRCQGLDRLDAVLLNAGIWPIETQMAEGHEETITVNVISPFMLAKLLLPKMEETAKFAKVPPRMSIVDSALYKFAKLPARKEESIFEELKKPLKDFDGRYQDSKMLVVLYGRRLAESNRQLNSTVVLNFVNPGYCESGLHRDGNPVPAPIRKLLQRSQDEGGRLLVDAIAPVNKVEERHGQYIDRMKVEGPICWVTSKDGEATSDRVWRELNEILAKEGVQ